MPIHVCSKRLFRRVLLALGLVAAWPAQADPALSAREVVDIQLDALQALAPGSLDGVATVWRHAHPDNRRQLGDLQRFGAMLQSPGYVALLGHRDRQVLAARSAGEVVEFYVTVRGGDGSATAYLWVVEKVADGEFARCWMTRSVSPAVTLNRSA